PRIERSHQERIFGLASGPDGVLYVMTPTALHAHDSSGAESWSVPLTMSDLRDPFVAPDGTIVVADGGGLAAITPDGDLKWRLSSDQLKGPSDDGRITD